MITSDYGVKKKPIIARNPQANNIIEGIHQTTGNMIRSSEVYGTSIDEKGPRTGILSGVRFATRATVHTPIQAIPTQLVFGRDTILNVKHEENWKYIHERKKKIIKKIIRIKTRKENFTTNKWQTKY
eukprot:15330430-Ditylum_brightwellii.AAC.1